MRVTRLVGAALLILGLPLYQSFEAREVLGRWSREYTAVMLLAALGWLGLLVARVGIPFILGGADQGP